MWDETAASLLYNVLVWQDTRTQAAVEAAGRGPADMRG